MMRSLTCILPRPSTLLLLLFCACGNDESLSTGSTSTSGTVDAYVPENVTSSEPICSSATTYPGSEGTDRCMLRAPSPDASSVDFGKVNLTLRTGGVADRVAVLEAVPNADSCGALRAWHYDNLDAPSWIVLCAEACAIAADPDSRLDIVVGCDTRCAQTDAGCAPSPD